MRTAIHRLIAVALALGFSTLAWPRDLTGQWNLNVEDKNHHVVTALVIEFTDHRAPSCIGGNWLRVNVVSATTEDAHFYPVSDPLSYSIENNQLTIGRNEVCDAYLMLHGTLADEIIRGEYFTLGWGSTPLGFFALSRKK
ncbi:MAG: hypothetical protein WB870_06560 [Gallionellaceae bacterium]